jgi:[histone H3]-lysine9 N-trimethyltransferase SUV39H
VPCYINDADIQKPLMTIFALRTIRPNEEVCFSYTGVPGDDEVGRTPHSLDQR